MKSTLLKVVISLCLVACSSHKDLSNAGKKYEAGEAKPNSFWWRNQVDLSPLKDQISRSNPYGAKYNYAKEFSRVNLSKLKKDIANVMRDSQAWWPADWGTYGGLFIRLAWHSAGTYRVTDGRGGSDGGQIRLMPLNSWLIMETSTKRGGYFGL